ncbi:MAG TPA: hypothetical protein DDZ51_03395 [Planctomycetaceae bacterium]|nr:hypothetical protein [Planctomycetaceae bacterium]
MQLQNSRVGVVIPPRIAQKNIQSAACVLRFSRNELRTSAMVWIGVAAYPDAAQSDARYNFIDPRSGCGAVQHISLVIPPWNYAH